MSACRTSSPIRRWTALLRQFHPDIELTLGQMPQATAGPICDAAIEALRQGKTHYPPAAGIDPLRQALAKWEQQRRGWPVTPEQIIVTNGAQEALALCCLGLLKSGEEVLVQDPCYPGYLSALKTASALAVFCPQSADFQPDCEAMQRRIQPHTRALILNVPANPTGQMIEPRRLFRIGQLAWRHDLFLIVDVVYEELSQRESALAVLRPFRDRLILINSFSKPWAMTGWRVGWLCGDVSVIKRLVPVHQALVSGVCSFAQYGALAALRQDPTPLREQIADNVQVMTSALTCCLRCSWFRSRAWLFCRVRFLDSGEQGMSGFLCADRKRRWNRLQNGLSGLSLQPQKSQQRKQHRRQIVADLFQPGPAHWPAAAAACPYQREIDQRKTGGNRQNRRVAQRKVQSHDRVVQR